MEKITTKKELRERIIELRAMEILARKSYEEDVITFKNFEIKDTIESIKKDEERHIKLLTEVMNLLKK